MKMAIDAVPLSRRLCPSISRNNEKKMIPTTTMSINFVKWLRQPFCFSMDTSQKLIRSSEIPREQPYQSYRAHKLFRGTSWKMAAYGVVPKKYI